ncbi:MAG: hypothetical protein IJN57_03375 [Oscillospiraceae bacterium]|nr:hypothetical protein [Oscillospiraceae bacterium]
MSLAKTDDFYATEMNFAFQESGVSRLQAIRSAIAEADQKNNLYWRFRFRFLYVKESIFCGDRYFAMICFPEILSLYDEYEDLQNDEETAYQMLVAFKWIVEAAPEFPQISKAEIDSYFRLFKRRLREQCCSPSIYHMKRNLFYIHCDPAIAAAEFYRFLEAPLDDISDGRALYYDQQVIYYLSIGEEEKALDAAKDIFSGKLTSNALPQATYHEFIKFYLKTGRLSEAAEYAKLTERRVNKDPYYLDIIGTLMTLYSILDPEHGKALFHDNYPIYADSKNPSLRMQFAIGAYHLFRSLADDAALPAVPKDTDLYPVFERGAVREAERCFYEAAHELASAFDQRNGTDDFMTMLQFTHPSTEETEE